MLGVMAPNEKQRAEIRCSSSTDSRCLVAEVSGLCSLMAQYYVRRIWAAGVKRANHALVIKAAESFGSLQADTFTDCSNHCSVAPHPVILTLNSLQPSTRVEVAIGQSEIA